MTELKQFLTTTKTGAELKRMRSFFKCERCENYFLFPRIVKPDAGFSNPTDVIHRHKIQAVQMCPECGSTNIKINIGGTKQ